MLLVMKSVMKILFQMRTKSFSFKVDKERDVEVNNGGSGDSNVQTNKMERRGLNEVTRRASLENGVINDQNK
jgi:hypothetical protein